ncbi:MAG TPA: hypothetical protein VE978_16475 [Chitinophagales bacterium]|nr:hypothetical protein [Chitinophagales bacterium]
MKVILLLPAVLLIRLTLLAQGSELWLHQFNSNGYEAHLVDMKFDHRGSVYVMGNDQAIGSRISKINLDGTIEWELIEDYASSLGTFGVGISFDLQGYLFSVEYSIDSCRFIRITPLGDSVSSFYTDYATDHKSIAGEVQFDHDGNLYFITGKWNAGYTSQEFVLHKFDPSYNEVWQTVINNSVGIHNIHLLFDHDQNLVLSYEYLYYNSALQKLDPDGNVLWTKNLLNTNIQSLLLDSLNNIFVARNTGIVTGFIEQYDPSGTIVWSYSETGYYYHDLIRDHSGSFYFQRDSNNPQASITKLSASGIWGWTHDFISTAEGSHLMMGTDGILCASMAETIFPNSGWDFNNILICFLDTSGNVLGTQSHLVNDSHQLQKHLMAMDDCNNVYVAYEVEPGYNYYLVLKFGAYTSCYTSNETGNLQNAFEVKPSLFTDQIEVCHTASIGASFTFILINSIGQQVYRSNPDDAPCVTIPIQSPAGVYLYHIRNASGLIKSGKIVSTGL